MPRIMLQDPWGVSYHIDTRNSEILCAWFDEILPVVNANYGQRRVPPAVIKVHPLFSSGLNDSADWHTESLVITGAYAFASMNGKDGLAELEQLRHTLQATIDEERGKIGGT